jgi:hypothetical protein
MFTKSTVSQALIDAVQAVMEADEKKKLLLEPGKPKLEGMIPSEVIAGQLIAKRDGQRAAMGKSALAMKTEAEKVLSPFDKGYKPAETPTPSHTSKKVSTGTVYTKNYKTEKDVKEEVEELDELSKSTLGSYAKKASRDAVITRKIAGDFEHQGDRARSPGMKAGSQFASQRYKEKSFKRRDGVDKAIDRLTKEEVEELDELSKKTLGSYIKKSSQNAAGQTFDAAHKLGVRAMNGPAMQDKDNTHGDILAKQVRTHFDKANSRLGGISKATDKLTREEKEGSHEDEKQDKALFKKLYKKAEDKEEKSEKEHSMKSEGSFDRENREDRRREHEAEYEVEKRVTKNREAAKAAKDSNQPKQRELFGQSVKEERHLTPGEAKDKEHYVKSMKKGMAGFKERYGNRAKSVMYATATKQAMKEEVDMHPAAATLLKHIKPEHHAVYKPFLTKKVFNGSYKDRSDVLNAAEKAGHLKEESDPKLTALHKRAQGVSQEHGVVQHINKNDHDNGHHVSDFYDDEKTVATYNKGKLKEEVELDEVSLGLAAKAYGKRASDSAESSHGGDDKGSEKSAAKADKTYDRISKKFGAMGADAANKSFIKQHFGEEEMKKEELKGKQHKIDKNKNGKIDAHDFKILRKEEKEPSFTGSHQGKTTIKHLKNPTVQQRMAAHDIKPGVAGYRDRIAVLKDAERMGNLKKEEAGDDSSLKIHPSHIDDSVKEFGAHKTAKTIQKLHDDGHIETAEANKHLNYINKNHKDSGTSDYKIDDSRLREEAPPFDKPYHNTGEVKKDKYGNIVKNVAKHLAKKGMAPTPKNEEVEELDELNKDTLHSYTKKAEVDQDKQFTKIGKAIRDNDPETGNKAGQKFSKRSVGLTKAYGKLEKESIGGISSMSEAEAKAEGETDMNTKTVDGLRGRVKVPATFHNSVRSYKVALKSEGKRPEDNSVPFVTDETSHTPMKLAKELARKSFKKIRTETLGQAGGTSEETKND